jgi:hypothetical protein
MKAFETTTVVEPSGEIRVGGIPFSAGTEVDVFISPKRISGDEFRRQWADVCQQMRRPSAIASLSNEEISTEVAEYRTRK